jgi:hypothetical protein
MRAATLFLDELPELAASSAFRASRSIARRSARRLRRDRGLAASAGG